MRSDWLRLRTHTGGSGDRNRRRVMMTSSRSVGRADLRAVLGGALTDKGRGVRGSGGHDLTSGVMRLMVSRSYPAVRKWVV